jgi:hypothetical protein
MTDLPQGPLHPDPYSSRSLVTDDHLRAQSYKGGWIVEYRGEYLGDVKKLKAGWRIEVLGKVTSGRRYELLKRATELIDAYFVEGGVELGSMLSHEADDDHFHARMRLPPEVIANVKRSRPHADPIFFHRLDADGKYRVFYADGRYTGIARRYEEDMTNATLGRWPNAVLVESKYAVPREAAREAQEIMTDDVLLRSISKQAPLITYRDTAPSAIAQLDRLEREGLVESRMLEDGGRAWTLTMAGALRAAKSEAIRGSAVEENVPVIYENPDLPKEEVAEAKGKRKRRRRGKEEEEAPVTDVQSPSCLPWVKVTRDPERYESCLAIARKVGPIKNAAQVYELLSGALVREDVECFIVVLVDVRGQLRGVSEAHRGQRSRVGVGVSDVMRIVIASGAEGFLVVHNHPSGNPTPSKADRDLTEQIEAAAKVYGSEITFFDHVVVGTGAYYSIREDKLYKV